MAPRKAARLKAAASPAAQSRAEVATLIGRIGSAQRDLALVQAAQDEELAAVRESYERSAAPLRDEIAALTARVQGWCEAHRDEITSDGRTKTVRFATGEVAWRVRPPRVTIRGLDAVIGAIRSLGLYQFLRTKVEVDREAMLREPDLAVRVDGVSIGSGGEDFVVTPAETPLAQEG